MDYTDRPQVQGVCLDLPGTVIRDDALWITTSNNCSILTVSIADAASWVPAGSALDRLAFQSGFTRRNGTGLKRILPHDILDAAHLGRREGIQHTLTVRMTLAETADGNIAIKEYAIFPSQTLIRGIFDFDETDAILKDTRHPLHEMFASWAAFAERLARRRRGFGTIIEDADIPFPIFNSDMTMESLSHRPASSLSVAQGIVRECNFLTNEVVARHCAANGIPVLYRHHAGKISPTDRTQFLADILKAENGMLSAGELVVLRERFMALRGMAYYSPHPEEHGVLNCLYARVTTPLRRYDALLVHQALAGERIGARPRSEEELSTISSRLNALERVREEITPDTVGDPGTNVQKHVDRFLRRPSHSRQTFDQGLCRASTKGHSLSSRLETRIAVRWGNGTLTVRDLFLILVRMRTDSLTWRIVKRRALAWLTVRSLTVRAIFALAHAELGWPLPRIDTKKDSRDQVMGIARIEIGTERFGAVSEWLPDEERATDEATLSLLLAVSMLPDNTGEMSLARYCAAGDLRPPRYSISQRMEGTRHFMCIVRTKPASRKIGITAIAHAPNETEARSRAACALLARLIFGKATE